MICLTDRPYQNNNNNNNNNKILSKGHPKARTLAEIKEKFPDDFFHDMQITSEPLSSDPCARLKTQIPTHSISWGCPKIVRLSDPISLLISTFGIHHEPGCKSHGQIIHSRTAKIVQNKRQFCSILRRIFTN